VFFPVFFFDLVEELPFFPPGDELLVAVAIAESPFF